MNKIFVLLFCVFLIAIAQIFLRLGVIDKNISSISALPPLIGNPYVVIGGFLYVVGFVIWLYILSVIKVSYAYPFLGLGYALVVILGYLFLGERITFSAAIGIILVTTGIYLIGINIQ